MHLGSRSSTRLTPREREIVALICAGKSYKEMAEDAELTVSTIKGIIPVINAKLGTHSLAQIVAYVARQHPGLFAAGGPSADDLAVLRTPTEARS